MQHYRPSTLLFGNKIAHIQIRHHMLFPLLKPTVHKQHHLCLSIAGGAKLSVRAWSKLEVKTKAACQTTIACSPATLS